VVRSAVCWTGAFLGGLQADYKKKDETLDVETAFGIVGWSLQHTETSLALIWLQGPDCPLIGLNPGLLLAYSLDITPSEDIYI
jgi:hypothetical protein